MTFSVQHLPFICKNNKFGCEEILDEAKLLEHEKYCKSEVCLLNYLFAPRQRFSFLRSLKKIISCGNKTKSWFLCKIDIINNRVCFVCKTESAHFKYYTNCPEAFCCNNVCCYNGALGQQNKNCGYHIGM